MRRRLLALTLLLPPALHAQAISTNTGDAPYVGFRLLNIQGEHYSARNVTLDDLTKFAYSMQLNQLIGMPDWAGQKRYDISATMQPVGHPSADQVRIMLRKLLTERFKLTFHTEQRVLPVYTLTIAKTGLKAPITDGKLTGDFEDQAPGGMKFGEHNATSKMWANYLQQALMNRPIIDQTALTGRYEFAVTFMPDDTMFGGRFHFPEGGENAAPNIFTALQEQLGLKLTPEKISVDVLVIDHAEEPTDN